MDRVLTLKQPHASAIFDGKNVENRTWSTNYRGRLWIHAGLSVDRSMLPANWDGLPRGVILGHVDLVDVVRDSDSMWAEPGCFHWVLENPMSIEPIAHRGGQGLRRFIPGNARVTS